jgi:hypothetical protein
VLDDDVTSTAQEGFYVVYLFAETLDRVYLSLNQGVTAHVDRFRKRARHSQRSRHARSCAGKRKYCDPRLRSQPSVSTLRLISPPPVT